MQEEMLCLAGRTVAVPTTSVRKDALSAYFLPTNKERSLLGNKSPRNLLGGISVEWLQRVIS